MRRTSVLDVLGVLRIVGYALALVGVLVAAAFYLAGLHWPELRMLAPTPVGLIIFGLLAAWVFGLSRVLVRYMHFQSPQD